MKKNSTNNGNRRFNALKHGCSSGIMFLPGEDPAEFELLWSGLVAEWRPNGGSEEEAVFILALAYWDRRRYEAFVQGLLASSRIDPEHPGFDTENALCNFYLIVKDSRERFSEFIDILSKPDADAMKKFAAKRFKSNDDWRKALKSEIDKLTGSWREPDEFKLSRIAKALEPYMYERGDQIKD